MERREFLKSTVAMAALGAVAHPRLAQASAPRAAPATWRISEHLAVYQGAINTGILRDGAKLLLIDCGVGDFQAESNTAVAQLAFTHHHRDQACGAWRFAERGARVAVPAAERAWFDAVDHYWSDSRYRWHVYSQHPHHLMLARPLRVDATYRADDEFTWGPARIRVLATPGHTDGSLSYLVEVDGKRTIFSGDAIYDAGRLWDIYSLQKGVKPWTDYHGFLGAREELLAGLARIKGANPDLLVPSHGRTMTEPAAAIDALAARLRACYDKYVAISAFRFYAADLFAAYAGRADQMPTSPALPVPDCLRHFGTTWLLTSESGAALAMDCGEVSVVDELRKLIAGGKVRNVEGLWITHYHDDHIDAVPAFQQAFACPCITDRAVADVIGDPPAWRIPCISPSKARVDRPTRDGESWQWHEFRLTAYRFPGQTLYHAGLLVEGRGLRMFFAGDSFTPGGIDDYCAQNRNFLGRDVGFDRCCSLLEKLRPTHIFNPHVATAFTFTAAQYKTMRDNLAEREKLFGELFPWDHPNYGMDDSWVRCHPYEQRVRPGDDVRFDVVITNHSATARDAACQASCDGFASGGHAVGPWAEASIAAKNEGRVRLTIRVPADAKPGRHVVPVNVRYGEWNLPQFSEAVVIV
jgi:glyoxylase-like metal-dependent hydrolase (beta-lactamase superfamily II)